MDGEGVVSGMQALIDNFAPMVTKIFSYVGTVCDTIVSEPLLLMTVGFLVIGGTIGIFGRLLSRG